MYSVLHRSVLTKVSELRHISLVIRLLDTETRCVSDRHLFSVRLEVALLITLASSNIIRIKRMKVSAVAYISRYFTNLLVHD